MTGVAWVRTTNSGANNTKVNGVIHFGNKHASKSRNDDSVWVRGQNIVSYRHLWSVIFLSVYVSKTNGSASPCPIHVLV